MSILALIKNRNMEKVILTGDRPTGKLHLGHYVGSLKRRVLSLMHKHLQITLIIPRRFVRI